MVKKHSCLETEKLFYFNKAPYREKNITFFALDKITRYHRIIPLICFF